MAKVDIGDITFGRLPRPRKASVEVGDISYGMLPRPGGPSVGIGDISFGRLPRPSAYDEFLMAHYGTTPEPSMYLQPPGAPSPYQFEGLGPEAIPTPEEYAQSQAMGEAMRNPSIGPDGMFPMQPGAPEMKRLQHMQQYPHQYGADSIGGDPQAAAPAPGGFGGMEIRGFRDPVPQRVDLSQDLAETLRRSGSPDDSYPAQYGEGERLRIADMMANPEKYEQPSVSFGQPTIGNQAPVPSEFEFDWDRPPVPERVNLDRDLEETLAASGSPDDSWPMQYGEGQRMRIADMMANPGKYEDRPVASVGQPAPGGQPPAPGGFEFDWDRPPVPARVDLDEEASRIMAAGANPDQSFPSQADPFAAHDIAMMSNQAQMAGPHIPGAVMSGPTASPVPEFDVGFMAESPEYKNFQLRQLDEALMNQRDSMPRMGADAGFGPGAMDMAQPASPGGRARRGKPASKMQKKVMEMFGGDMAAYDRWHGSLSESDKNKVTNWSKAFKHLTDNPQKPSFNMMENLEPAPEPGAAEVPAGSVSSVGDGATVPRAGSITGRQRVLPSVEESPVMPNLLGGVGEAVGSGLKWYGQAMAPGIFGYPEDYRSPVPRHSPSGGFTPEDPLAFEKVLDPYFGRQNASGLSYSPTPEMNMSYERPYSEHMSYRKMFPEDVQDPYGYGEAAMATRRRGNR